MAKRKFDLGAFKAGLERQRRAAEELARAVKSGQMRNVRAKGFKREAIVSIFKAEQKPGVGKSRPFTKHEKSKIMAKVPESARREVLEILRKRDRLAAKLQGLQEARKALQSSIPVSKAAAGEFAEQFQALERLERVAFHEVMAHDARLLGELKKSQRKEVEG